MSYTQHGLTGVFQRQPDSELTYHNSGLIEGTLIYKCEPATESVIQTKLGSEHPDDSNVKLYAARVRRGRNDWWTVTYDCIGIVGETTTPVLSFPNSVSTEPIETHKYFRSPPGWLAGKAEYKEGTQTIAIGDNGAVFQMSEPGDDGKRIELGFIGFVGDNAPDKLRGLRSYYSASLMCKSTYYTKTTPYLKRPCRVGLEPKGDLPIIDGFQIEWLHLVSSCEQIDKAGIWRVTEDYIAGEKGRMATEPYQEPT